MYIDVKEAPFSFMYISFRFLTGLAHSHENSQLEIAKADTIPIIHRLEQVSSNEHVGSLAENLLEALCTNPAVAKQIEEVTFELIPTYFSFLFIIYYLIGTRIHTI